MAGAGACLLLFLSSSLVDAVNASPAAKPRPTSKSILAAMKRAMAAEDSVRCVVTAYDASTKVTTTITEDAGRKRGLESLMVGEAKILFRLTPTAAFVSGNTAGLKLLGLTSAQLKIVGKKWIFTKPSTSQYSGVDEAVTIKPLLQTVQSLLPKNSKVVMTTGRVNGQAARILKWSTISSKKVAHLVLDVTANGPSLPIRLIKDQGKSTASLTFSNWGEPIHVLVPTSTVTLT